MLLIPTKKKRKNWVKKIVDKILKNSHIKKKHK